MSLPARRTAPYSLRIAAAAMAAVLPISALAVNFGGATLPSASAAETSAAIINAPFATQADAEKDGYVSTEEAGWRQFVYQSNGARYNRMEELKVHSPSMNRDIPIVTIRAEKNAENAPTIYLLNGADGGTGKANWLQQTSAIDFYGNRIGNVNVVIPMAGKLSFYTDWQQESTLDKDGNGKGGKQMWETFLTQELPGSMESHLGTSSNKRALIGMSMSASSALVYAEQYPGLYDSIASYSGCPATSGAGAATVDIQFEWIGSGATYEQMWGDRNGATALRNDAYLNADKLKDQHNVYISSGTGLMGEHDMPSGDRLRGFAPGSVEPAVVGGAIEGSANACTHMMKATTDKAGITEASNNLVYNFRNTGTHQWGYWQEDMFQSWPTISAGLFGKESVAAAQATSDEAAAAYLADNQGVGTAGSLPAITDAIQEAAEE